LADAGEDTADAGEVEKHLARYFKGNIIIPDGKCPVNLQATDQETVEKWAVDVVQAGRPSNLFTDEAIIYFVREFYDCGSDAYNTVVGYLKAMFAGEEEPAEV